LSSEVQERKEMSLRAFKAYPKYKDSGVEWLGKIPAHWEIKQFKRVARLIYGDSLPNEKREVGEIEVYGSNGPVGFHSTANTLAPALVIGRKGSYGKVNFVNRPLFAIDTTYIVDERSTNVNLRWLFYVVQLLELDSYTEDSAIPGLAREFVYGRVVPKPALIEQLAIVEFVDREPSKLDALILKNEQLIELLQEKRTALISQAVTKGLNADAKMKDSGIEWLGKIPEHWEQKKFSRVFQVRGRIGWRGYTSEDLRDKDEGVLVLGATNVDDKGKIDLSKLTYVSREKYEESPEIKLKGGELLIVKVGATIGKVGLVPADFTEATVNPNLMLARSKKAESKYFFYFLHAKAMQAIIGLEKMAGAQDAINQEFISNLSILFPPIHEQCEIADYLDRETAKIDSLITKIREAIDHLKEYRTALISTAVTGKIDVRGETA
jgi:type I restriction enzyme S subunit